MALYAELFVCYKALILRFTFPSLIKSEFKAEPEAQDTSCYPASCFISRVVLLVGLTRITSHLFPVRTSVVVSHNCPADPVELDVFEKPDASFSVVKCGFRSPRNLIPQLSIKTICTKSCDLGLCECSSMLPHLSS